MNQKSLVKVILQLNDSLQEALSFATQIVFDEDKPSVVSKDDMKYMFTKLDFCAGIARRLQQNTFIHEEKVKGMFEVCLMHNFHLFETLGSNKELKFDDRSVPDQRSQIQRNDSELQLQSRGDQGGQSDMEFMASIEQNRYGVSYICTLRYE
jgi:hypothetical protein